MSEAECSPHSSPGHLCVFVHGLWGNPKHLNYVASRLRGQYPQDSLHILQVARNSGSFTYDGIELGAERVTREIEEKLEQLPTDGHAVKKLSIIGYSLGGLVSRYAVGLLFHNGWFDKLEPVNFTTFATPHLGVRTPLKGIYNRLFNVIGARTLSTSGHQLFMIDEFRETGKPILTVLSEPDSIFMRALGRFKHRCLYSNITNDRSAVFYTTYISPIDPYADLSSININYLRGYEPVILDPEQPTAPKHTQTNSSTVSSSKDIIPLLHSSGEVIKKVPFYAFLAVWVPIGLTLFLLNAGVQNFQSQRRIQLHQQGKAGIPVSLYRVPLAMRRFGEELYEEVNQKQGEEYLSSEEEKMEEEGRKVNKEENSHTDSDTKDVSAERTITTGSINHSLHRSPQSHFQSPFPTLALHPAQFAMITSLNELGWRKYPVHIHKARHSHAAIIKRMERQSFEEGSVVVGHWVAEFEV